MEWIMIEKKWHEIAGKMQVSVPVTKAEKIARILGDTPAKKAEGMPVGALDKADLVAGAGV